MLRLGRELRRSGHRPTWFGYFAWAERYDRILARLQRRLAPLRASGEPYALIGHSLGGLLLREALATTRGAPPAKLVMIGTPNRCPRLARHAWRSFAFRWAARECGRELAEAGIFARLPAPDYPYLVIAGTRGFRGRWSPFGDEPNDGIVAVSETELGTPDHLVTVPAAHTFLMDHPATRRHVLAALA